MKLLHFLVPLLLLRHLAHGALEWESKQIDVTPALADTVVHAAYRFTNTGKEPVTIESVEPTCGCTTAVLDRKEYQPGEKGHIDITFTMGQRTGLQNKPVAVRIRGESEPITLSFIVRIPEFLKVTPQFLYWQVGDMPEPKTILLSVEPGTELKIGKILSDSRFKTTLETIHEGKEYRLIVQPATTSEKCMAAVTIEAIVSGNVQKFFSTYAHIKPAEKK